MNKQRDIALNYKKDFKLSIQKIKRFKKSKIDSTIHSLHYEYFSKNDCTDCANCCKYLGPRILDSDIKKIAKYLKLKPVEVVEEYFKIDEDGDYVFKTMPCPFLQQDNLCLIYDIRPKACRDYPHTNQTNIKSILSICVKNTEVCPGVFYIMNKLRTLH